jgi:hypothetical protein
MRAKPPGTRTETRVRSSLRSAVRLRGLIGGLLRLLACSCSALPETRCAPVWHTGPAAVARLIGPQFGADRRFQTSLAGIRERRRALERNPASCSAATKTHRPRSAGAVRHRDHGWNRPGTRSKTRARSSLRAAVRLRGPIGGLLRLLACPCSALPETRCAPVWHTGQRPLHASLAPSSRLIAVSRHHWPASANAVAPWREIPPPARCPILSRPPWSSRFAPLLHPALRPSPSRGATRLIARRPRSWLGVPSRASARSAP